MFGKETQTRRFVYFISQVMTGRNPSRGMEDIDEKSSTTPRSKPSPPATRSSDANMSLTWRSSAFGKVIGHYRGFEIIPLEREMLTDSVRLALKRTRTYTVDLSDSGFECSLTRYVFPLQKV